MSSTVSLPLDSLATAAPLPLDLGRRRARPVAAPERPRQTVFVRSEQDIVDAVLAAARAGEPVRALGSGGSKNACAATRGTALRLDHYDRLLAVRGNLVTVEAGMTVARLLDELSARGLSLPTPGEWAGATVAGALSTGTHGGALGHGIFPTSVRRLRLVTAAGDVLELAPGDELFDHAAVSLGLLGVVSTVTLECVPRFHLEMTMRVHRFDEYLRDHATLAATHEYLSAIWVPTARRVVSYAADRIAPVDRPVPRPQRYRPATFVANALSRTFHVHAVSPRWFAGTARDDAHRILAPIRNAGRGLQLFRSLTRNWGEAEFAIPLARAPEALAVLDRFFALRPDGLTIPVGLRASAGDRFSLSPCHGRDTLWIAVFFHGGNGFAAALRQQFEALDARCHWGKHVALSPAHLRAQYPRWEAFRSARRALDPAGRFANSFARSFDL